MCTKYLAKYSHFLRFFMLLHVLIASGQMTSGTVRWHATHCTLHILCCVLSSTACRQQPDKCLEARVGFRVIVRPANFTLVDLTPAERRQAWSDQTRAACSPKRRSLRLDSSGVEMMPSASHRHSYWMTRRCLRVESAIVVE